MTQTDSNAELERTAEHTRPAQNKDRTQDYDYTFEKQADGLYTKVFADGARVPNLKYYEEIGKYGYRETVLLDGTRTPVVLLGINSTTRGDRQDTWEAYKERIETKVKAEYVAAGKVLRGKIRVDVGPGTWHQYEELLRAAYDAAAKVAVPNKKKRGAAKAVIATAGKGRGVSVTHNNVVYASYAAASRATDLTVTRIKKLASNNLDGWSLTNVAATASTTKVAAGKGRGVSVKHNIDVYASYAAASRATNLPVTRIKKLASNNLGGWSLVKKTK